MDEGKITKEKLKETMVQELQANTALQETLSKVEKDEREKIIDSIEQITDWFSTFAESLSKLNIEQK